MSIARCRHCHLPLTDDEARSGACPTCGGTLAEPTATPAPAVIEKQPRRSSPLWLLAAAVMMFLLVGWGTYPWVTQPADPGTPSIERLAEMPHPVPAPAPTPVVVEPRKPEVLAIGPVMVEPPIVKVPDPVKVEVPPMPGPMAPAGGKLRVQYLCREPAARTNQLSFQLKILNDGDEDIPLSELSLRYWYTRDGDRIQNHWCDYADLGATNVQAGFRALPRILNGADTCLEIRFGPRAPVLKAGRTTGEIQHRVAKEDWSNYNQADDYSFAPRERGWVDAPHITLYRKEKLIWGTEPGTRPQ
jgi:hypothetical protein